MNATKLKTNGKMSRDERRVQIAEATLSIIARSGVKSLTTAAIAKEVGVSEGNLYRHFKNKDEIFSETVEMIREGLKKNLENVLKLESPSLKKLKKAYTLHLDYIEKNEGIPRLVFSDEMHLGNEKLRQKLLATINAYSEELESLMREGQQDGSIRGDMNPKSLVLIMIGMIQVMILKWSLSGFSFPLVDEGMKLWRSFEKCVKVQ